MVAMFIHKDETLDLTKLVRILGLMSYFIHSLMRKVRLKSLGLCAPAANGSRRICHTDLRC